MVDAIALSYGFFLVAIKKSIVLIISLAVAALGRES